MKIEKKEITYGPGVKEIFSKRPFQLTLLGFSLLSLIIILLVCFLVLIRFNRTETTSAVLSSVGSLQFYTQDKATVSKSLSTQFKGYYQLKGCTVDSMRYIMITGILATVINKTKLQQNKDYNIRFSDPQLQYLNGRAKLLTSYQVKGGVYFKFMLQQVPAGNQKYFYHYPATIGIITGKLNFLEYILKGGS